MNKIVYFGVNTTAFNILKMTNLSKDLLVSITEDKAIKLSVTDYYNDITKINFTDVYYTEKYSLKSQTDEDFFKNYKGDLGIVIGWHRLIPPNIIKTFKYGIIGFHGTPYGLPKGRGRSPVIWSIVHGEEKYHFYLFLLREGVDDGPIYFEKILDINNYDSISSFNQKIAIVAASMLNEVVPKIFKGEIIPFQQKDEEASYFPKRGFEDGKIYWNKPSIEIYNLIRALSEPYPCAHTYLNDKIIKIIEAQPFSTTLFDSEEPGHICAIFANGQFVVKTCDGSLLVKKYKADVQIIENEKLY